MILLTRNQPQLGIGVVTTPPPDSKLVISDISNDMLEWVAKSPWHLVQFYKQQLRQKYGHDGAQFRPPLGSNDRIYLRAAQRLLKYGEVGIRAVVQGIAVANYPPSLQWIARTQLEEESEVRQCPHNIPPELTLLN